MSIQRCELAPTTDNLSEVGEGTESTNLFDNVDGDQQENQSPDFINPSEVVDDGTESASVFDNMDGNHQQQQQNQPDSESQVDSNKNTVEAGFLAKVDETEQQRQQPDQPSPFTENFDPSAIADQVLEIGSSGNVAETAVVEDRPQPSELSGKLDAAATTTTVTAEQELSTGLSDTFLGGNNDANDVQSLAIENHQNVNESERVENEQRLAASGSSENSVVAPEAIGQESNNNNNNNLSAEVNVPRTEVVVDQVNNPLGSIDGVVKSGDNTAESAASGESLNTIQAVCPMRRSETFKEVVHLPLNGAPIKMITRLEDGRNGEVTITRKVRSRNVNLENFAQQVQDFGSKLNQLGTIPNGFNRTGSFNRSRASASSRMPSFQLHRKPKRYSFRGSLPPYFY